MPVRLAPLKLVPQSSMYREELTVPVRLAPLKLVPLRLGREESEEQSHESDRWRATPGNSGGGIDLERHGVNFTARREPAGQRRRLRLTCFKTYECSRTRHPVLALALLSS